MAENLEMADKVKCSCESDNFGIFHVPAHQTQVR